MSYETLTEPHLGTAYEEMKTEKMGMDAPAFGKVAKVRRYLSTKPGAWRWWIALLVVWNVLMSLALIYGFVLQSKREDGNASGPVAYGHAQLYANASTTPVGARTCTGDDRLTNVALGKPTDQINTYHVEGASSHAVDGNTNSSYHALSCTHTHKVWQPWWMVDLQQEYVVTNVIITGRADCCHERLAKFEIRVGNHDCCGFSRNALCHYQELPMPPGNGTMFVCDKPLAGSTVSIQLKGVTQFLTLCEVQVMSRGMCV